MIIFMRDREISGFDFTEMEGNIKDKYCIEKKGACYSVRTFLNKKVICKKLFSPVFFILRDIL